MEHLERVREGGEPEVEQEKIGVGLRAIEFATDGSKTEGEDGKVGYGWCAIHHGDDMPEEEEQWGGLVGGGWLEVNSSNNSAEVRALADIMERTDKGVELMKGYVDSMCTIEGTKRGERRGRGWSLR